ncbi:MAG: GH77, partial [uncultured Blastococcus sp.]
DTDTDHRRVGHRRQLAGRTGRGARGRPGHHRPVARGHRPATGRPGGAGADRGPARRRAGGRGGRRRLRGRRGPPRRRRAARRLPAGLPLAAVARGAPPAADRLSRPVLAPRRPRLGLGGAALRRPQPRQLGHRRPRRPARPPPDGRRPGRRFPADQPAARGAPHRRAGGEPVPAGHPALPQPRLPAGLRGPGGGRRRPRGGRRPGAVGRLAHRPRRRLGPQARGADADLLRPRRRGGVRALAGGAWADPAGLGDVGGGRRGARRRLAHLARAAAPSGEPGAGRLRAAARRRRGFPRLAAVGPGPAVHRRHRGHDGHPGPADRRRRRRRRRLGVAGRARGGRQRRRPAGRLQQPGPGLGLPAADPVAAARRRLRAVHPVDPGHHRGRRWSADRPRHGPVPAVVGPVGRPGDRRHGRRRGLRALSVRGPAEHRRAGEPPGAGPRRRGGPRHRRGRRPGGHGRARDALLPAALVRGRRPGAVARGGDGRDHHPRPADGGRPVDRGGRGGAARVRHRVRRGARARPDVAARPAPRAGGGRVGRGSGGAGARTAGRGTVDPAVGHAGRRPWRAAPAQHAGDGRPAQLVAAAPRARGGPGRPPPAAAGGRHPRRGRARGRL